MSCYEFNGSNFVSSSLATTPTAYLDELERCARANVTFVGCSRHTQQRFYANLLEISPVKTFDKDNKFSAESLGALRQ